MVPAGEERSFLAAAAGGHGACRRGARGGWRPTSPTGGRRWRAGASARWGRWRRCPRPRWRCGWVAAGAWLHRLAGGQAEEPFVPQLPPDALEEGTELDYPLYELEPLAFVLRGLLDRALARLACRGLACAGLGLRLKLDPRGFDVRDVPLAAPTRETAHAVAAGAAGPGPAPAAGAGGGGGRPGAAGAGAGRQLDLWRPGRPRPRAAGRHPGAPGGAGRARERGRPALVDSYREEAVERAHRFAPTGAAPAGRGRMVTARRARASAASVRPQPLEVLMDRDGPVALRGRNLTARVLVAAGPYRSSGDWWTEEASPATTGTCRPPTAPSTACTRTATTARWYLDGYYD